jgi:hypothetical protein
MTANAPDEVIDLTLLGRELRLFAPPGQSALSYKRGSYLIALDRMLAQLPQASADNLGSPLADLNLRVEDDWSVGLLHAGAAVTDVLSFYQERIINEGYLRTATEDRSLFELGRTVGYELKPGLGASTSLAFTVLTLKDEPPRRATVPAGTPVQSVPRGVGQLPQIFETSQDLVARSEWNRLKPGASGGPSLTLRPDVTEVRLAGVNIGVQPGAQILIVGDPVDGSQPWLAATVTSVQPSVEKGYTRVAWDEDREAVCGFYPQPGLDPGQPGASPGSYNRDCTTVNSIPQTNPRCYLLQAPVGLFGYTHGGLYTFVGEGMDGRWLPAAIGLPKTPVRSVVRNGRGTLLAATGKDVFRSTDGAASWHPVPVALAQKDITALAVLDDDRVLLAGTADGGLYLSQDEGDNWAAQSGDPILPPIRGLKTLMRSPSAPLPKTVVRSLAVRPWRNGIEVIAGTDTGVLTSTDRGRNWEPRNIDLPQMDPKTRLSTKAAWAVAASPDGELFAATDEGVYRIRQGVSLAALPGLAVAFVIALLLALWFSQRLRLPILNIGYVMPEVRPPWMSLLFPVLDLVLVLTALIALVILLRYVIYRYLPSAPVVRQPVRALLSGPDGRLYAAARPVAPSAAPADAPAPGAAVLPAGPPAPPAPPKPAQLTGLLAPLAAPLLRLFGRGGAPAIPPEGASAGVWRSAVGATRYTFSQHPWLAFKRYFDLQPIPAWQPAANTGLDPAVALSALGWDSAGRLLAGTLEGRLYRSEDSGDHWVDLLPGSASATVAGAVSGNPSAPAPKALAVAPPLSGSGGGQPAGLVTPLPGAVAAAPGAGNDPSLDNPTGASESVLAGWRDLPLKSLAALGSTALIPGNMFAAGLPGDGKLESGWSPQHLAQSWLDLDKIYPGIQAQRWLLLRQRGQPAAALYRVAHAQLADSLDAIRPDRLTRLTVTPATGLDAFDRQTTAIMAQGVELTFFDDRPVSGEWLPLDQFVPGLTEAQPLVVSGKRVRARCQPGAQAVLFGPYGTSQPVLAGESLEVLPPASSDTPVAPGIVRWTLRHRTGFVGTIDARPNAFILEGALAEDEVISEAVRIQSKVDTADQTLLLVTPPLVNRYDRTTVTVYANVVPATQGDTVTGEVLGTGDGASSNAAFVLRQEPLTYLPPGPEGGSGSTLEVRVNGLTWEEAPVLAGLPRSRRAYMLRRAFDGNTRIIFGDGRSGARLPRGTNQIVASYRIGSGVRGNVPAGSLTLLQTTLTDIKEVTNPVPGQGGSDPEPAGRVRIHAPLRVRVMERVISRTDLEDYALNLPGIAKARVQTINREPGTAVSRGRQAYLLTVAAEGGQPLGQGACAALAAEIDAARSDPAHAPLTVVAYDAVPFRVATALRIAGGYQRPAALQPLLEQCRAALRTAFSFDRRDLDQSVAASEVIAALQGLPGIVAIERVALYVPGSDTAQTLLQPGVATDVGAGSGVGVGLGAGAVAGMESRPDAESGPDKAVAVGPRAHPSQLLLLDAASAGIRLEVIS